jgi:hypothetical protein
MRRRWLSLAAGLALAGCGEGTTGRAEVLHTRLTTELAADRTLTTSMGWTVTLKKAAIAAGPFYYFDGEPAFTQRRTGPGERLLAWLAPVGTAQAHPGHYVSGRAKGQMLKPFAVDLLAGPAVLPDGDGVTGLVQSGTFSFAPPSAGPAVGLLEGQVALTEGTATRDGKVVNFRLAGDLGDVARTARDAQITGCPFSASEIASDGTVTVTVKPRVWFNLVDFGALAPGTAEAPTAPEATSVAQIAFALGLAQLSAYQFAFDGEARP